MGCSVRDFTGRVILGLFCLVLGSALAAAQDWQEKPELRALFTEAGTTGTILIHDHANDRWLVSDKERALRPYAPSSTFKIPNTLLALRTGVVSGMDESFGPPLEPFLVRGKPFLPEACNARVTLAVALVNSCIPVYQDIAVRIGVERYNEFLQRMNYAKQNVTEANLRTFWLDGSITLSAKDQVAFLDRMMAGRLPFQTSHIEAMWAPLAAGESGKGTIFAKTGFVFSSTPEIGWYIGWVRAKDGDPVATFALNLDLTAPDHARARREITTKALRMLDLW